MATAGSRRRRRKLRHEKTSEASEDFIQTRSGRQLSWKSGANNLSKRGQQIGGATTLRKVLKGTPKPSKISKIGDDVDKGTVVVKGIDLPVTDKKPEQGIYLAESKTEKMERLVADVDSTSSLPETFYSAGGKGFELPENREDTVEKTRNRTRSKSSMLDRLLPTPGFVDKPQLDTQGGVLARRRPPRMAGLNAAAKVNLFFEPSSPLAGKSLPEIFHHSHNPKRNSRKHSTTSDEGSRSSETGSTESAGLLKDNFHSPLESSSGGFHHMKTDEWCPSSDKDINNGFLINKINESRKQSHKHVEQNLKRGAAPDSSSDLVRSIKKHRSDYRDSGSSSYLESLMKNGDQREQEGNIDSSDMEGDLECDTTTENPTMVDVCIQVDLPRPQSAFKDIDKHRVRVLNVPVRAKLQTNTATLNFTKNHVVGPLPPLKPTKEQLMSKTANTKRTASLNAQAMVNAMLGSEGPLSKLKNAGNLFVQHAKVKVLGGSSAKENINGGKGVLIPVPPLRIPKINFAATSTSTFSAGGRRPVGNPVKSIHLKNFNVQRLADRRPREPKRTNGWMYFGEPLDKPYCYDDTIVIRRYYSSIKRGDEVINVRDAVLLKAGTRRKDLPFVARVSGLWEEDEGPNAGEMMMSVFWYYRPEQTEVGRIPDFHGEMEVMASRHKDDNSVACIVDKCYTLSYPEYCRFRAQAKLYQESRQAPIAPVPPGESTRPGSIPPPNTDPSLVFFCRQVYDYRMGRIMKNPGV